MGHNTESNKKTMQILGSYLYSSYWVHVDESEVLLKVGQLQPLLDPLLQHSLMPTANWAVLSGHNPGSRVQSEAVNRGANQLLETRIVKLGLRYWPVTAGDCQGDFPDEDCFLIVGITHQQLAELALYFGQNAAVIGSVSSAARLLIFPQVWKGSSGFAGVTEFVDSYILEK